MTHLPECIDANNMTDAGVDDLHNNEPYEADVVVRRKVHAMQKDFGWDAVRMYASSSSASRAIKNRGMHLIEYDICLHPLNEGKYCVHFACEELEDVIEIRNRGFGADYMGHQRECERLNVVVVR